MANITLTVRPTPTGHNSLESEWSSSVTSIDSGDTEEDGNRSKVIGTRPTLEVDNARSSANNDEEDELKEMKGNSLNGHDGGRTLAESADPLQPTGPFFSDQDQVFSSVFSYFPFEMERNFGRQIQLAPMTFAL